MPKQKTVVARLFGGLGNQLFIYAAARRLALKNGAQLKFDLSRFANDSYSRTYELHRFNIDCPLISSGERLRYQIWRKQHRFLKKRTQFINRSRLSPGFTLLSETDAQFISGLTNHEVKDLTFIDGYWQCERYFNDIDAVLRKDLAFRMPMDEANQKMADRIQSANAICVHARRYGEKPRNPRRTTTVKTLGENYYDAALRRACDSASNPHVFLFGDEPVWVRDHIKTALPHTWVDINNTPSAAFNDMRLMSLCNHFIIANSSFSWWSAWLGTNPDKQVYCPPRDLWQNTDWAPGSWHVSEL